MGQRLHALLVEDSDDDAELLLRHLRRGGYDVVYERVQIGDDMRRMLAKQPWDVVISDYSMPNFAAPDALRVLKESGHDIPFIVVSGTIGEETAVETLKAGAHDFLVKGRLARLIPAITREMREAAGRRERRDVLARVEESERRLSAIFNQVAVGIAQTDLDGRLLSANQRFGDLVGRPLDGITGLRIHDLTHPDDRPITAAVFERLAQGEHDVLVEKRLTRGDGPPIWVNSSTTVVAGREGQPMYTVSVVQDITARKHAEASLLDAIRARDEFLSIASHELKTPITSLTLAVASGLEIVRSRRLAEVSPEKLESKMVVAARQADRLTALINNLLDVARITSGRLAITPTRIDLVSAFEEVAARSRQALRVTRSELVLKKSEPVVGTWDVMAIEAVLSNLLSNAIKFGEGRPIEVDIHRHEDRAVLIVTDHGLGIAPEEQSRIFGRFERAVSSQHYGGFGIGLWIARQMAEAHGGTVRVKSESGVGSTFTVELPLDR